MKPITSLALLLLSSTATAQMPIAHSGVAYGGAGTGNSTGASGLRDTARVPTDNRAFVRIAVGSMGWVTGAYLGAHLGVAIGGSDCGGCDDPGLSQMILGGLVGSIIGTGVGVGTVSMGDGCSNGSRIAASIGGAFVGTLGGILMFRHPYAIPVGAVLVSTAISLTCNSS